MIFVLAVASFVVLLLAVIPLVLVVEAFSVFLTFMRGEVTTWQEKNEMYFKLFGLFVGILVSTPIVGMLVDALFLSWRTYG